MQCVTLAHHQLLFRQKCLDLSTPKVMGVLNITPDSFSDGGCFTTLDKALFHCQEMIKYGVDIIDIGGESTRPNAQAVSLDEELSRVVLVVEAIRQRFGEEIWLSLDTSSPKLMQEGILAGADIINDVRALRREGAAEAVSALACPVVLMHSRGEPQTMNELAIYEDVVKDVKNELGNDIERALQAGILRQNIIIDVGMGFAKNYQHHQALMRHLAELIDYFKLPMLFGVSRKRFLGEILLNSQLYYLQNHTPKDRDDIGVLAHMFAIMQGASIVRVHDVKAMVQAVKFYSAMISD